MERKQKADGYFLVYSMVLDLCNFGELVTPKAVSKRYKVELPLPVEPVLPLDWCMLQLEFVHPTLHIAIERIDQEKAGMKRYQSML